MADGDEAGPPQEGGDRFYGGIVASLQRGAQRGTIRSDSGREIPFIFAFVTMLGPHRRFDDLYEGLRIGFDVSWTSKGLRVSVIRIPD